MGTLESLLSQYSVETIILILVAIAVGFKFVSELWNWFYDKFRKHFNHKNEQEQQYDELIQGIQDIKTEFSEIKTEIKKINDRIDKMEEELDLTTERLQENTRSYIIDRHHYFCYILGEIDDYNLQALERRYLYYKSRGGNSFVDDLMRDIRKLPRVSEHIYNPAQNAILTRGDETA